MMTQLITAAPDLPATTDAPDASDSSDSVGDGFANLLTAMCAAPLPLAITPELIEATPAGENALPVALMPGDGINPNAAGVTAENTVSLPALTEALTTDTELSLHNPTASEAAVTAIKSEINSLINATAEAAPTSPSTPSVESAESVDAADISSAVKTVETPNFPGVRWELKGDEAKAAQPLQAEAARRDVFTLASTLAETNRQTRPMLTTSSLSSFLAGREGGDEASAKQTSSSSLLNQTTHTFGLEMASASNALTAGGQSAAITGQVMNPILAASETMRQRETRTLRLSLQPEDLGQVEVQITRHAEGQFSAKLSAEHDFARQALADGLGQLRAALERAGLPVERLEVNIGSSAQFGYHSQAEHQSAPQSESQSGLRATATEYLDGEPSITSGGDPAEDRLLSLRV